MKSTNSRLLILCSALLLLISCTTSVRKAAKSKPEKAAKPVVITFWAMEDLGGSLTREIRYFEKQYPDIRVRMTNLNYSSRALPMLEKAARSGKGPDLVQVGSTWVPRLASLGMLPEVSDSIDGLGGPEVFTALALENATIKDSDGYYALPWVVDVRFLSYRKDALENAGLGPNDLKTLADFQSACAKVDNFTDSTGKKHHALGTEWPQWWINLMWLQGTDVIDPKQPDGLWNEKKAAAAIEFWLTLQRKHGGLDGWNESYGGPVFAVLGPWEIRDLNSKTHGIVPIPAGPAGAYTFCGGSLLAVPSFAEHKHEAQLLAEFLLSRKSQLRYCQAMGNLPARRDSVAELARLNPFHAELDRQIKADGAYLRSLPKVPEAAVVEEIFTRNIYGTLQVSGAYDPNEPLGPVVRETLKKSRREVTAAR